MFIFATHARAIVESFLVVVFALAPAEAASARAKKHRGERPVAPTVERSVLPITLDESGTPIIMLPPVPSPSPLPLQPALPVYKPPPINSVGDRVTNCLHSFPLNAGLGNNPTNRDFYVRSPASTADRVSPVANERSARKATIVRFPPRAWTAAYNCPFPGKPKALDQHAFLTVPVALIFTGRRHLLAMVLGSPRPADRGSSAQGRLQWPKS
jgi:hypothetical protein